MKLKYYNFLLAFLVLGACNEVEVVTPDFDVSVDSTTVDVNEEVTFNFSGDAKQISFYSGEILRDYAFKDGRTVSPESLDMSFTTTVQYGAQQNQFSVLASTDFSGEYNMDAIRAATWTDITSKYPLATNTTQRLWGPDDLFPLIEAGKPIYIAFKYLTRDQTANGSQRTWSVRAFQLNSSSDIGSVEVANLASAEFKLVHDGFFQSGRTVISASTLTLRGNTTNTSEQTEDWAISKPIILQAEQELGPDKPFQVKGLLDVKSSSWKHTYTQPGTYVATFVAANNTIYGNSQVVKQVTITVNP